MAANKQKRSMQTNVFFFPAIAIAAGVLALGATATKGKIPKLADAPGSATYQANMLAESKQECWARLSKMSGADLNDCNVN